MNLVRASKPCARIRLLLDPYISNELLVETNVEVLQHVAECPDCRTDLNARLQARDLLRRAVSRQRVGFAIEMRIRLVLAAVRPTPLRRRPWLPYLVAASLTIITLTGLWIDNARSLALLQLGYSDHVRCALAGDYQRVAGDDYAGLVRVIGHFAAPYEVRAAHLCRVAGREFVHVVLESNHALMSVSILRKVDGEKFPPHLWRAIRGAGIGSIQVAGLETGDHLVFVTSSESAIENHRMAANLAEPLQAALLQ